MLYALEGGWTKLDEYYSQTDGIQGHIYRVSMMLVAVIKFKFFLTKDWDQKMARYLSQVLATGSNSMSIATFNSQPVLGYVSLSRSAKLNA